MHAKDIQTVGELAREVPRLVLGPDDNALNALDLMDAHGRYAVGVERDNEFLGIFTYEDYLSEVLLRAVNPRTARLEDHIDRTRFWAGPDELLEDAYYRMTEQCRNYLPVTVQRRLICVLSANDVSVEISRAYKRSKEYSSMLLSYISCGYYNPRVT